MTLRNEDELAGTRKKLRELEERYGAWERNSSADPRVRELSMTSLKRLINQLKEEIARYQARQPAARG